MIAECVGWQELWDYEHGPSVVRGINKIVRAISYPDYSSKCPLRDISELDQVYIYIYIYIYI